MLLGTGPRGGDPEMEHRVLGTAVHPVPSLEDFLYLFFGRSETAARAGRDFWERRHRRVDQDPPSSPEVAKAQIQHNAIDVFAGKAGSPQGLADNGGTYERASRSLPACQKFVGDFVGRQQRMP
jgi:hypothetical protein